MSAATVCKRRGQGCHLSKEVFSPPAFQPNALGGTLVGGPLCDSFRPFWKLPETSLR